MVIVVVHVTVPWTLQEVVADTETKVLGKCVRLVLPCQRRSQSESACIDW